MVKQIPILGVEYVRSVDRAQSSRSMLGSSRVEVPICFLKGTRILTSNGYKEIEQITKNDSLYTHDERLLKPKSIIDYTANEKCKDNIPYKVPKNYLIGDNSCIIEK